MFRLITNNFPSRFEATITSPTSKKTKNIFSLVREPGNFISRQTAASHADEFFLDSPTTVRGRLRCGVRPGADTLFTERLFRLSNLMSDEDLFGNKRSLPPVGMSCRRRQRHQAKLSHNLIYRHWSLKMTLTKATTASHEIKLSVIATHAGPGKKIILIKRPFSGGVSLRRTLIPTGDKKQIHNDTIPRLIKISCMFAFVIQFTYQGMGGRKRRHNSRTSAKNVRLSCRLDRMAFFETAGWMEKRSAGGLGGELEIIIR